LDSLFTSNTPIRLESKKLRKLDSKTKLYQQYIQLRQVKENTDKVTSRGGMIGGRGGRGTTLSRNIVPAITPLPPEIQQQHQQVVLCADIFYVDSAPFLATVSRGYNFITIQTLQSIRLKTSILPQLQQVINLYRARGLEVPYLHTDNEFDGIQKELLALGTRQSSHEQVPEIERAIRTIKERVRNSINTLPFQYYPKMLVRHLMYHQITWLNSLPKPLGVSTSISPRELITGIRPNYNVDCRVPFGSYCLIDDEHPTNTQTPRTSGAIALDPTTIIPDYYHFLSLETGTRVSRRLWKRRPMSQEVITSVNDIAQSGYDEPPEDRIPSSWAKDIIE
jgi:hypothetical protein